MWRRGIWNWMGSGLQSEILRGFDAELLEDGVMRLAVQRFGQSGRERTEEKITQEGRGGKCEGERDKRRKRHEKGFL